MKKITRRPKSYTYKNITYPSVKTLADVLEINHNTLRTKIRRCMEKDEDVVYNGELIKIITY